MRHDVIGRLHTEELMGGWAPQAGERAGYKCEYCDKDMLANEVDYGFSWQHDHIIPRSAGGEDTFENIALSCSVCNMQIKKDWNPAEDKDVGENTSREELIEAVRRYVKKQIADWEEDLSRVREIVGWPVPI